MRLYEFDGGNHRNIIRGVNLVKRCLDSLQQVLLWNGGINGNLNGNGGHTSTVMPGNAAVKTWRKIA